MGYDNRHVDVHNITRRGLFIFFVAYNIAVGVIVGGADSVVLIIKHKNIAARRRYTRNNITYLAVRAVVRSVRVHIITFRCNITECGSTGSTPASRPVAGRDDEVEFIGVCM